MRPRPLRLLSAAAVTGGAVLLFAAPASAHVTATPDTTAAGAYALVTFGVPHGCEESATTRVSIQVPEDVTLVIPTVNAGWDVETVVEAVDPPIEDSHGDRITERVAEVVYTARRPLPSEFRDAFDVLVQIPEDAEGETLSFPTVQACEEGEAAWVELPKAGQDPDELDYPAPAFEVTAAEGDGHGGATDEASAAADASGAAAGGAGEDPLDDAVELSAARTSDDAAPGAVTWIALAVGAAGLLAGVGGLLVARAALARSRRDA